MSADLLPPPDATDGIPCCMASAIGDTCSCWMPLYDQPRDHDVQEGPSPVRELCCHDCAYRNDSPERTAGEALPYDYRTPFYCHDGMPRVIAQVHPAGALVHGEQGDYDPIVAGSSSERRAWQADGQPGVLCAGWAAFARARAARERPRVHAAAKVLGERPELHDLNALGPFVTAAEVMGA